MKKYIIITLIIAVSTLKITAQIPKFSSPVEGTYLKDYFITSYVDWIPLFGFQDYNCGNKSYDLHMGTDFLLKSFARMDSGVYVLAAAAGTVVEVADTFFDRNKNLLVLGAGNYVAIKHTNNYYTYYTHLRKKSLLVKVGDVVVKGQRLGLIGSSGYSSDPQLHFEVWDSIQYVDPFTGPCGNTTSMWTNQFVYDSVYRIMDKGLIPVAATLDILRERYPSKQIFTNKDSVICFWVQESGIKPGGQFSFKWYDPQGNLTDTFSSTYFYNSWYYYNWSYINFPKTGTAGLWHVKYYQNGVQKLDIPFTVQFSSSIADNQVKPTIIQAGKQISVNYPSCFQIRFFDIRGKLMIDNKNLQGTVVTDVSAWPTGAYILQFTAKEGVFTQKLIVR